MNEGNLVASPHGEYMREGKLYPSPYGEHYNLPSLLSSAHGDACFYLSLGCRIIDCLVWQCAMVHKHNGNGLICAFLTCHLWLCGAHGVFLCIHFCFIFNTVCNGL